MSFLQILPEELTAAATQLGALGTTFTAQNAAAAAPTTAIAPAASDLVSTLQAALFASYGTLYQQISAEAAAIHDQFVNTLGISAGTYEATESINQAAAVSPFDGFAADIGALSQAFADVFPPEFSGGIANIINIGLGNWASATSVLVGLAGGGLLPAEEAAAADAAVGGDLALGEIGAAAAAEGGAIAAGIGTAGAVGGLSVPPAWAGATLVSSTTPAALTGAGFTAAPAAGSPGMLFPGGLANAARNSAGFGAPRYGVKPIVMPKLATV
ncbi:PE family protein [Mycobacterium intermedium]|uniref:PE family protein n=1 Tax=Mycobacterium intermedium TaxID=28445 RepID=A0A1E3S1K8_MYCIE|nr:PE domain-containing protein [Mycobacterium intermedium]MCV6963633.1 PE domain-containing protein [Mycobacterium intermedium]ODQ96065.1 PE family protein [Mycobacterium intermedium]OPE52474.1 PE family protein [Mycobacterium intermedium]ORB05300.1 PE family protein [Mycobacterium intermedium]